MSQWAVSQHKSKKISLIKQKEVERKVDEMLILVNGLEKETSFMAGRLAERVSVEKVLSDGAGRVDSPSVSVRRRIKIKRT